MWAKPGPWDNVVDFFIALGSLPLARLADEYRIRETEGREPMNLPLDKLSVWVDRGGKLVLQDVFGPPEALVLIRDALERRTVAMQDEWAADAGKGDADR